jgi:hypothetical protein
LQNLAASVPLLASQLGRPISQSSQSSQGSPNCLSPHPGFVPCSISPLYFVPIGNGKIMSRNLNGTSKNHFKFLFSILNYTKQSFKTGFTHTITRLSLANDSLNQV